MTIKKAFQNFKSSNDLEGAIIASTKASWGGGGYSVELFDDGDYRVLWDNQIGNLYDSEGVVVGIPSIPESDWDGEDENEAFFDNAIETLDINFEDAVSSYL